MSENVELVRSIYADWERGDFGKAEWADPEIEVEAINQFESGTYRGLSQLAAFWGNHISAYEDYRVQGEEFRELDAERVLVLVEQHGRGKASGIAVNLMSANVFHVRNGRVVRLVIHGDRDRALADLDAASQATRENVATLEEGYEWFRDHGRFPGRLATPDFIWDMSHFQGWPEQQVYEGIEGANDFIATWGEAWDDWRIEVEAMHEAGEKVVTLLRQGGRSKVSGMRAEMSFAMVWSFRDGLEARMDMYSDTREALRAVGLED
jgi:ketosteroid isomerase-like protein